MRDWSKADWVDPQHNWKPLPVSDMPERLLIDFATRCNLRCHMCPVWGLEDEKQIDDVKGIMDLDAARKMLDEFSQGAADGGALASTASRCSFPTCARCWPT